MAIGRRSAGERTSEQEEARQLEFAYQALSASIRKRNFLKVKKEMPSGI